MSEKEELEAKARKLIDDYHTLKEYQRYILLKETILKDSRLQNLLIQSEQLKKSARFFSGEEKKKALSDAKSLYDEYQNDPLVVNYEMAKTELLSVLSPLIDLKL